MRLIRITQPHFSCLAPTLSQGVTIWGLLVVLCLQSTFKFLSFIIPPRGPIPGLMI